MRRVQEWHEQILSASASLQRLYDLRKRKDPAVTWKTVAAEFGHRDRWCRQLAALHLQPAALLELLEAGRITPSHVAELAALASHPGAQLDLAREAAGEGMSRRPLTVRDLRRRIAQVATGCSPGAAPGDTEICALEAVLSADAPTEAGVRLRQRIASLLDGHPCSTCRRLP